MLLFKFRVVVVHVMGIVMVVVMVMCVVMVLIVFIRWVFFQVMSIHPKQCLLWEYLLFCWIKIVYLQFEFVFNFHSLPTMSTRSAKRCLGKFNIAMVVGICGVTGISYDGDGIVVFA